MTIRGANSLRGDNQPLYVIDNVPQSSTGEFAESAMGGGDFQIAQDPLSALNPADIEDITVLKMPRLRQFMVPAVRMVLLSLRLKKGKQVRLK